MFDVDDDAPPPLSSLQGQVEALTTVQSKSSGPAVATITAARSAVSGAKPAGFKKGFFDSAPTKKAGGQARNKAHDDDDVIHIKASPAAAGGSIPAKFMLDPSTPVKQLQEVKQQLTTALQPTPALMKEVTSNPNLLHGFDDPEVMAAVSAIASDPAAFKKYSGNAKVMAFYQEMAKFAAMQMDAKAASASGTS